MMNFLLESVEGGAVRGRYSIIGIEPDSSCASWASGRDQSDAAGRRRIVHGAAPTAVAALRTVIGESACPAGCAAADGGRVFGYLATAWCA